MDAEVCVVGGGIVGLWSAYHLAKQGVKTILFEKFLYPHTRGSSHGQTRLIRYMYSDEEYTSMMPECYRLWEQIEKEADQQLFLKTGLVAIFNMSKSIDVAAFRQAEEQMNKHAPSGEIIPGYQLEERFPGLKFDSNHRAIYDMNAGVLKADQCLTVLQKLFVQHGGKIRDGEGVTSINPISDSRVEVITTMSKYSSRSIILACGPFTNEILSSTSILLPLTVMRPVTFYWKCKSQKYLLASNFPSISLNRSYYSSPEYEYPGMMKLWYDAILSVDPNERDMLSEDQQSAEKKRMLQLKNQIRENFPDIDTNGPAIVEQSVYTKTPDDGFIIDFHPKHKNVIIGSGFSGHGFKTAPAVGHMLSNMAMDKRSPYPLEAFSIHRFDDVSESDSAFLKPLIIAGP